jgi:non-ribosomal peptide synthetase component F
MRTNLSGDPSVREILRRARETALEAFQLQHVPFERVVEAVQPERHPSRSPLFQVMLNLLNTPMEVTELPGLVLEPLPASTGTAKFDLTLGVGERPDGLVATLEHDLDLFDPATAARWVRHLTTLVRAAVEDPERRISELPLLSPEEREEILLAWNRTEVPYPRDLPLHRLVEEQVDRNPAAVALVVCQRRIAESVGCAVRTREPERAHSAPYADRQFCCDGLLATPPAQTAPRTFPSPAGSGGGGRCGRGGGGCRRSGAG